jgi:ketosteroid isomerase-like protein
LLVASALCVPAAGCGADKESPLPKLGGSDAAKQVRTVVERFGAASRAKDYQTICDQLLSDELVHAVEEVGLPCESALQRGLGDVRDPQLQIKDVSVSGARALVSVHSTAQGQPPSDDAIQLVREGGTWRIASLAEPQSGSTAAPASSATPSTKKAKTNTTSTVHPVPTPDHGDRRGAHPEH